MQERSRTLMTDCSPRRRTAGSPTTESARLTRTQTEGASRCLWAGSLLRGERRTRASPPRRIAPALVPVALGTVVFTRKSGGAAAFQAGCRSLAALAGSGSLVGGVTKRLAREPEATSPANRPHLSRSPPEPVTPPPPLPSGPPDTLRTLIGRLAEPRSRPRGDWLRLGLCYPQGTIFRVTYQLETRVPNANVHNEEVYPVSSLNAVEGGDGKLFFFEESTGLLFMKVRANYDREGYNYCSHMGCERIVISATMTSDAVSDCTAAAYPKYSLAPTETVPMPSFLSMVNDCTGCGAPVDGVRFDDRYRGFMVIAVDALTGAVTHQMTFDTHGQAEADAAMANFIRSDIPKNSIVLVATRDTSSRHARECLIALMEVGAQEPVQTDFRGNFAVVGFKGTIWPTWIQQVNLPSTQGPAQIYTRIPLMG
ncbi:TMEM2 [Branchiostoma lanceolatum]|uniref:TMEM2 protein n=1 Tax=Branchiostoma lanceolatum TaxID=7740 RepID=A0A8K0ABH2_BRALA|nr:TMEM2 [Branchiostoma lanceolatum]